MKLDEGDSVKAVSVVLSSQIDDEEESGSETELLLEDEEPVALVAR